MEKVKMTRQVGNVSRTNGNNKSHKTEKQVQVTVKQGDTLAVIAKKFGMKPDEFKQWVGLKSNTLKIGQKINLPNDTVPAGKGILALARKYNMTLEEFGKLNNLPKPYKEYSAAKGEKFYVKNKKAAEPAKRTTSAEKKAPAKPKAQPAKPKATAKSSGYSAIAAGAKIGADAISEVAERKQKWGSAYTPEELAHKIYEGSKKTAAVGKPDFDALINEINPKNVEAVLEAYTKKESLINTITSEIWSDKKARENAVMKIYDALAKAKKTPAANRNKFYAELHEQLYDSWGMASTKKLDKMINEMLSVQSAGNAGTGQTSNKTNPKAKITLNNNKNFTAEELQKGAIASAKGDEGFRKVKNPYIVRPLPNVNEKGQIEAACEIKEPTNKSSNAPLKGKVVIVNAGHGGYNQSNGYFDAGTVLSVKNAQGQEMPIEEWRVAGSYTDELTQKLQAKGATVVVVSGPVKKGTGGMYETKYLENLLAGNRGSAEVKKLFKNTKKSDMAFISIHVESVKNDPSAKACTVRANHDDGDRKLAKKVQQQVGSNIYGLKPKIDENDYYVTRAMGPEIPAVLVELGNIANKDIAASLLSSNDRGKYTTALATAIEETLLKK